MRDHWENYSFTDIVYHKDWPITVEVDALFYKGKTPAMGDDPDCIEIVSVRDGTGKNIWPKLNYSQQKDIEAHAYEESDKL